MTKTCDSILILVIGDRCLSLNLSGTGLELGLPAAGRDLVIGI